MRYDTILVSDIHLGSPMAMANELYHLLSNSTFNRLILLGDIFSDLNFNRLTSDHWRLISLIRKLSNPKRGVEVVWVEGNHDANLTQVMEHLIGVKVYQRYEWVWNGKKCIAMHGHQFDSKFLSSQICKIGITGHLWLQSIPWLRDWLPAFLDKIHTKYTDLSERIASGALQYARHIDVDMIFCGHTHKADYRKRGNQFYWNSGCWINNSLPSCIVVTSSDITIVSSPHSTSATRLFQYAENSAKYLSSFLEV